MTILTNRARVHLLYAGAGGLALRLFFILRFPFTSADDTKLYEELAGNWLAHGVYGMTIGGHPAPVNLRMPGYPAFLAVLYAVFGRRDLPVLLAQALVDLAGCFAIAALAWAATASAPADRSWQAAPAESRWRVALAALWLAALCPFTANYAAAPLTEVLATFFTALALLVFAAESAIGRFEFTGRNRFINPSHPAGWFLLGGLAVGLGTLVRPETPLVLVAAAAVLVVRWRRPRDWRKLASSALLMGLGLLVPLAPWAMRNWRSLHRVEFLAPRYAELPGEFVPRGFYAWTRTWLWRFGEVYLVPWKLGDEPVPLEDVSPAAFDSPRERERVAALLAEYNRTLELSPELDSQFARLARDRTRRHPLRTYLWVPLKRAAAMWFTPRVELLPFSGHLWPVRQTWGEDPVDFSVSLAFSLLNFVYAGLAAVGGWRAWRSGHRAGVGLLLVFLLVRSAFVTQVETPEPRYVLECFPALLALGAQTFVR